MSGRTPKTKARLRFLLAFVPTFVIAFAYWPIAVLQSPIGTLDGWKWVQNHPAISVFDSIILPFIAGILAAGLEPRQLRDMVAKGPVVVWSLLVLLILLTEGSVYRDSIKALNERVVEPLEFRRAEDRAAFLVKHKELRDYVRKDSAASCEPGPDTSPVNCYLNFTKQHFNGATLTLTRHGGIVAWYQKVILVVAAFIVAVFLWYIAAATATRSVPPARTADAVLACWALFGVWFPLNLYSHWYTHFRTFERIEGFDAFYMGLFFFVVVLAFARMLRERKPTMKVLAATLTGASFLVGVLAKFQPELFGHLARVVERFDPWQFAIGETALLTFLLVSILGLGHDIEVSQAEPAEENA